jgi:hypothetical protein
LRRRKQRSAAWRLATPSAGAIAAQLAPRARAAPISNGSQVASWSWTARSPASAVNTSAELTVCARPGPALFIPCSTWWTVASTAAIAAAVVRILMERHNLTSDQAFDVLRRYSQQTNTKLRDVGQQVIDSRRKG